MRRNRILKINNKMDCFYYYMGRFFGSRIVQNKIKDRVYDDANKEWYVLIEGGKPVAFLSMTDEAIKNVYGLTNEHLEELLKSVKKDLNIQMSILPKVYLEIYKKLNFEILDEETYKNFVVISSKESGKV